MSLWDQLPGSAQNGGALSELEDVLNAVDDNGVPDPVTDADGTWKSWTKTYSANDGLSLLGFGGAAGSGGSTPIEFLDPNITIEVGLHQTGSADDGGWRVTLTSPIVAIHAPFLTPATYDLANARLKQDSSKKNVSFIVPALKLQLKQLSGASVDFKVISAATTSTQVDDVYDLVRMDPPYALIGPSDVVGFGFRSAVLDLSGVAGPSGVPAGARTMPNDWQGLYLPEVRLFVQPNGLDGLAVTAAAKDLWIGIGASAGVTGVFEAEVVNALQLTVSAHVLTQSGAYISVNITDTGSDPVTGTATVPADCTLFIDTHGGSGANSVTITPSGATPVIGTRAAIHTDAGGQTVQVTVNDSAASLTKHLTLTLTLDSSAAGGGSGSATSYNFTPTGANTQFQMYLDSIDPVRVAVRPALPEGATLLWTSSTVPITGPANETSVTLDASALTATNALSSDLTLTVSGSPAVVSDCFFAFDHPKPDEMPGTNTGWALNAANSLQFFVVTSTTDAGADAPWPYNSSGAGGDHTQVFVAPKVLRPGPLPIPFPLPRKLTASADLPDIPRSGMRPPLSPLSPLQPLSPLSPRPPFVPASGLTFAYRQGVGHTVLYDIVVPIGGTFSATVVLTSPAGATATVTAAHT